MKHLLRSRLVRAFATLLGLGLVVGAGSCGLVLKKDRTVATGPAYERQGEGPARVAVVYFSRSGNTELVARQIARRFDARLEKLETDRYPLTYAGLRQAGRDATDEFLPAIEPATLDLSEHELVFLGSPIWWYRPATPLWAFVETADLEGKKVVLFNTFNSRFKQEKIDAFGAKVRERGGELIGHLWVRRGRVYWQKSTEEILEEAREKLEASVNDWLPAIAGEGATP